MLEHMILRRKEARNRSRGGKPVTCMITLICSANCIHFLYPWNFLQPRCTAGKITVWWAHYVYLNLSRITAFPSYKAHNVLPIHKMLFSSFSSVIVIHYRISVSVTLNCNIKFEMYVD
jgi:hypothetical protein